MICWCKRKVYLEYGPGEESIFRRRTTGLRRFDLFLEKRNFVVSVVTRFYCMCNASHASPIKVARDFSLMDGHKKYIMLKRSYIL